ncbi:phosphoethanolamine--lipid A transferase [Alteromonas sp. C1M14]|uniref:phosphoethanolamine transferase n=1 Tax=Alteromonas sp. C1M14 TaxID=2841567 RepID=UPI001C097DAE|nr:phosphoethanolamine--lipid A transferase [Alteromonas sp. C1M14]MBU2978194.1 phosphoethanolamine--lipid A transferase [Alteromonas sp. C1M14]
MKLYFSRLLTNLWKLSYCQYVCLAATYLVIAFNGLFLSKSFQAVTFSDQVNWLFIISIPCLLFCLFVIFLSCISLITFVKPVIIVSVLISSVLFYSTFNYGVIYDKSMLQNIIETNSGEALSYLNVHVVVFFIFTGVMPAYLFFKIEVVGHFRRRLKSFILLNSIACLCCILIAVPFYKDYAAVGRNNQQLTSYITPFAFYSAAYKYLRDSYFYPPLAFTVLDKTPVLIDSDISSLTVMVVGETARAANFSSQGYSRDTNNFTTRLGMIYFKDVSSCGTATAISVPCMFSRLGRKDYDARLAQSQDNALDIIQRSGVEVTWIDNNSSCKGVCARVNALTINPRQDNPLCDGHYCYDEILVKELARTIASSQAKHQLVILHMIGSHGPTYFRRYPNDKKLFIPDCPRSDIQNCSNQALINTYDNTIVYTDWVLSELVSVLKNSDISDKSLLYVSDHGESLGEKGLYLHGFPYALAPKEQTHVPMLFWSNKLDKPLFNRCVRHEQIKPLSHDNIFDTLLGLTHVSSSEYRPTTDIFNSCTSL